MKRRTWVAMLMLISIILIDLEVPSFWWSLMVGAAAGLSMTFAVNIIFGEIGKAKR